MTQAEKSHRQTETMANPEPRPLIVGPDSGPEAPFPLQMEGKVISGFGRGSKEASGPRSPPRALG